MRLEILDTIQKYYSYRNSHDISRQIKKPFRVRNHPRS